MMRRKSFEQWLKRGPWSLVLFFAFSQACTPTTGVEVPNGKVSSTTKSADQGKGEEKSDTVVDFPAEGEKLGDNDEPEMEMDGNAGDMPDPDTTPKPDPGMDDNGSMPTKPEPEPKEQGPVAEGRYLIKSVHSGRCLDIPNASQDTGVGLEIYDCASNPSAPQIFELIYHGEKLYEIRNVASGKSLEVRGQVMASEKLIQQAPYVGGKWQQFIFQPQDDGTFVIKCNGTNLVFDVQGAKTANKTPIQIWPPNNFVNERFTLTPVL